MRKTIVAALGAVLVTAAAAAQTPQPFPKPGSARPSTPPATSPAAPAPATAAAAPPQTVLPPAPVSNNPDEAPTESTLGVPVYPGAEFLRSYDAGKGQRYYIFGANADFNEIVNYYKNVLKQKGELVYEAPPMQQFDLGKYKEDTMAFPPSVTVKDYTTGGTTGYLNPHRGKQPAMFKTIIQIVPATAGQ